MAFSSPASSIYWHCCAASHNGPSDHEHFPASAPYVQTLTTDFLDHGLDPSALSRRSHALEQYLYRQYLRSLAFTRKQMRRRHFLPMPAVVNVIKIPSPWPETIRGVDCCFWDLPTNVRNRIYDYLTKCVDIATGGRQLRQRPRLIPVHTLNFKPEATLHRTINGGLVLVSRRWQDEYVRQVSSRSFLSIHFSNASEPTFQSLQAAFARVPQVYLKAVRDCRMFVPWTAAPDFLRGPTGVCMEWLNDKSAQELQSKLERDEWEPTKDLRDDINTLFEELAVLLHWDARVLLVVDLTGQDFEDFPGAVFLQDIEGAEIAQTMEGHWKWLHIFDIKDFSKLVTHPGTRAWPQSDKLRIKYSLTMPRFCTPASNEREVRENRLAVKEGRADRLVLRKFDRSTEVVMWQLEETQDANAYRGLKLVEEGYEMSTAQVQDGRGWPMLKIVV